MDKILINFFSIIICNIYVYYCSKPSSNRVNFVSNVVFCIRHEQSLNILLGLFSYIKQKNKLLLEILRINLLIIFILAIINRVENYRE